MSFPQRVPSLFRPAIHLQLVTHDKYKAGIVVCKADKGKGQLLFVLLIFQTRYLSSEQLKKYLHVQF